LKLFFAQNLLTFSRLLFHGWYHREPRRTQYYAVVQNSKL
jgi:hypothetical protein